MELEVITDPVQTRYPPRRRLSAEQMEALSQEVESLVEKEAVVRLSESSSRSFMSELFVIPKADGRLRPVIDLRELNTFLPHHHFKMEGIPALRDLLQPADFMTKVDLKDPA